MISNDLRLEPPQQALIVSGPNAGGKTVAVSAIALCAALLQAGMPVPAKEGQR